MAQQTKAAASMAAPTGPVYTAVHPTAQSTLADVQVPAQTLASGTAAVDGQWAWVAYAPDGTDVSAHLDDDTLARPTLDLAAAVAAGCRAAGTWNLKGVPTVNAVAGPAITLRLVVGAGGKVRLWRGDFAALASNDWTTGGTTRTVDGLTVDIVSQGSLDAGSGPNGTTGLVIEVAGSHGTWSNQHTAPMMSAKIQSIFDLHGLTYSHTAHEIDWIVSCAATPAPTNNAGYGVAFSNGLWSTSTTEMRTAAGTDGGGTPDAGSAHIMGTTDAVWKAAPAPGAYPRWIGARRAGRSIQSWVSTTEVVDPTDIPTFFADGYQSFDGKATTASTWTDATDRVNVYCTNAGVGTSAVTFTSAELWASL